MRPLFFPYLGYDLGNEALLNTFRIFEKNMGPEYKSIYSSFEMQGEEPCCDKDRGDAAMIAYGAAHFAMASGSAEIAEELWPTIEWCLEYCHQKTNKAGVVTSETDEMEDRIPAGEANLATSCLTYGALNYAITLGNSLGKSEKSLVKYKQRAERLKNSINSYFGKTVEGYNTYQYFSDYKKLRHWISMPLTVGILDRKEGTLEALFGKLWTENGLHVESDLNMYWDRATLYALRGALMAGDTDRGLQYLKDYSCRRLLGSHVPYPVEAWPEGNQAHLSAESALYCRIFIEGLFGIKTAGFNKNQLPAKNAKRLEGNVVARYSSFWHKF